MGHDLAAEPKKVLQTNTFINETSENLKSQLMKWFFNTAKFLALKEKVLGLLIIWENLSEVIPRRFRNADLSTCIS